MLGLVAEATADEARVTRYGQAQPEAATTTSRAVWGAIAYSPSRGKTGIFYGAPTRDEARDTALRHCRNAANQRQNVATDCQVTVIVYNDWDDRRIGRRSSPQDRAPHCGAVAASREKNFASVRASTLDAARDGALSQCQQKGQECKIVTDLCT
ncbi:DUF4189 domain-containing protein [Labrys sp. La1]|uniref:DUF4189 domain-containing protein n=1 Tax=Labrys sp. La1 TaxID=3404917 RepID=UPI003EB9A8E7